ncbi:hypothetical protein J2S92_004239 [Arthrobacter bambusae]|nr:hypothetical protein [Arthrobacter bambusae]MDQ0237856.1 hypothetical protein [Arthrobacter bambusae]
MGERKAVTKHMAESYRALWLCIIQPFVGPLGLFLLVAVVWPGASFLCVGR